MTSYRKTYSFTDEQKKLLRDLLIYLISHYDYKIEAEKDTPRFGYRSAIWILHELSNDEFRVADDTEMWEIDKVINLCNPVSDEVRSNIKHGIVNPQSGLEGILSLYSNDVITGLKGAIQSGEMYMASTSSFCKHKNEPIVIRKCNIQGVLFEDMAE